MEETVTAPKEESILDRTLKATADLKAQLDRREQVMLQEANARLGGRSEAGQAPVVVEESAEAYAKRVMGRK